ncbi:MAG: 2-oxo acid dehydrogenase subunit E2 [Sulfobacillus sp.]|nr:2-oxo acid dehydrogenase subunit E2 [Sulfobacillus sp.]
MANSVIRVDLGERADAEAVLVHWMYQPGAFVRQGTVIGEAMLDKVTIAIEAPMDGYFQPRIDENGVFHSQDAIAEVTSEPTVEGQTPVTMDVDKHPSPADDFVPAPPRVRRYAQERGVDLREVARQISGRSLTVQDIDDWLARSRPFESQPYSPFRQQVIRHLTDSEALPTTLQRRVRLVDPEVPILAHVAKALERALGDHPVIHGWATHEGVTLATSLKLGIAVQTPRGLIVPVISGNRSLEGWVEALRALREAARSDRWEGWEFTAPSFVISNLGPWGIEYFTPRLMPPTIAVLGLGQAADGLLPVSLTFDHRALDGADAAAFLRTLDHVLAAEI